MQWAISKDVDIISMSITVLEESIELKNQIDKAKGEGKRIIIVCSTHDEGTRILKSWPAAEKSERVMVVTACDQYGQILRDPGTQEYNYMIQGQKVAAGVIPFLESSDSITGSSVSTALAAGISSLILTCSKLARLERPESEKDDKYSHWKTITEYLKTMTSGDKGHVLLEKFGEIDTTTRDGDNIPASRILKEAFGMLDIVSTKPR
jgi:hypothetical protein